MSAVSHGSPISVLVIDDEKSMRESVAATLDHAGYSVKSAATAREGAQILQKESFQIIVCDHRLPDLDGISFIAQARKITPAAEVILMTAYGDMEFAVSAIRGGAYDYLAKPFSPEDLVFAVRRIEEREKLRDDGNVPASEGLFSNIIAESKVMKDLFTTVQRLSAFSTTVLVVGESGTGKELLARAIHQNSPRRTRPFVAINCGAIPENLLESELFGHVKGSFTDATRDKKGLFEEADGGTIFLDEIGEMPLHLQVKLLRALQEQSIRPVGSEESRKIDIRIVAATLRDLEEDVAEGRFREDLFYRLSVVSLEIPPLRARPEDIEVLVTHFMKKHNKRLGLSIKKLDPKALKCLVSYSWKGNVRELENCIERALVLTESDAIDCDALPDHVRECGDGAGSNDEIAPVDNTNLSIKQRTCSLETELIRRALKQTGGNRTHAARILEISHRALLYKLKEYGLEEC
jgi:two-component system response regulator AtoC